MRYPIICLKPGMCLLVFMLVTSSGLLAESTPGTLKRQEVEMYRQIARHVFNRIVALKDKYPHLALIESAVRKEDARDKLWIAYHYTHGLSWVPNPHHDPHKKSSPRLKSFSPKDGIELNLYFYEGEWMGQAAVRPVNIGAMKVVSFIDGDKTQSVAALRHDIGEIVSEETTRFRSQR
jgi:hypothetical protein